ncbi:MAG TPA: hypothetical protein VGM76_16340 [Lacipirellulaceae bacterium]|jgi:hypothetical protein
MSNDAAKLSALAPLGREEYIEQAHFFRALAERLRENVPAQEVLASVREEVLATTKLPMAIDFLLAELRHAGAFGAAMSRLDHYFTPFQAFVVQEAENERGRFDLRIGLEILRRESEYRAAEPSRQGIFLYQLESLARNRLGYDRGLEAVARDPAFDSTWQDWIRTVRRQIGMVELADLIYVHSEHYRERAERNQSRGDDSAAGSTPGVVLFGEREGRIALANRRKDPLYLFASLHRQLGYPEVPRPEPTAAEQTLLPQLARRLEQMEMRLKLVEEEQRGGIDLTQFYERPGENRPPKGPP